MNKKQKCGEVLSSPSFGGGPMYDEATARKMLEEEALVHMDVVDDRTNYEEVIGFDPDDAALDNIYDFVWELDAAVTPMLHFVKKGDLKMCRYLVSRGASTTKASRCGIWFPMIVAAREGNLDACKFLFANGSKSDVRRANVNGWTPLAWAAARDESDALVRWLVLEGALCADASSEDVEGDRFYPREEGARKHYSRRHSHSREMLIDWAERITQSHASIIAFLHGTLPPRPEVDGRRHLKCLSVHPGIRKHVCGFVGQEVKKKKHLNILRQVKSALSHGREYGRDATGVR